MPPRVLFVALTGLVTAACGLSVVGQLEPNAEDAGPDPTFDGARANDQGLPGDAGGGADGGADADTVDATLECDSGLGDSGVLVVPPDGGACPAGTVEKIVHTSPVAAAGACTCGTCTPVTNPSCAGGSLNVDWGSSNSCSASGDSYDITDNACIDWGYGSFTVVDYHGWELRTPTAGSCTATAVPDVSKVTTTAMRTCVPSTEAAICAARSGGLRLCVDSGGAACAGTFSQAVVVGDAADVACAACGCSRTSTKCTVEYHSNDTCTSLRYTAEANGTCTRTNNATSVQYLKVYAASPTCTATPGAATPSVTNPKTLCCTP